MIERVLPEKSPASAASDLDSVLTSLGPKWVELFLLLSTLTELITKIERAQFTLKPNVDNCRWRWFSGSHTLGYHELITFDGGF